MFKGLLKNKIPFIDASNPIENVVNYMIKTLNESCYPDQNFYFPVGSVFHSSLSVKEFRAKMGDNWNPISSIVINNITVNIFIKVN